MRNDVITTASGQSFLGSRQKLSPLCFASPVTENQPFIKKRRKTLLSALNKPTNMDGQCRKSFQ